MIELTEREKKIIIIKFIMHGNSPFTSLPIETREKALIQALNHLGFDYDKDDMLKLGKSILAVQQEMLDSGYKFLTQLKPDELKIAYDYCSKLLESSKLSKEEAHMIETTIKILKHPDKISNILGMT